MESFKQFNLSPDMMSALSQMGFSQPTPVQRLAIGPMMQKKDIVVQSPTGTGKTAAFGIPMIEDIDENVTAIQAVVVCPTRELALQITDVLHQLTAFKQSVRALAIYGGENIETQIRGLKKNPQIIVATPGRLLDHLQRKTLSLKQVKLMVLDEADRMLDMGFLPDMRRILQSVPRERQTVMFSATISSEVLGIAERFQKDAEIIKVGEDKPVETVLQYVAEVENKTAALLTVLKENDFGLVLIFTATKRRADRLARQLNQRGFKAGAIHGDLSQNQRERVMGRFRNREIDMLVATDVAARGIDVTDIDAVINYDIPSDHENYTHRIGRTGRANARGVAYTFTLADQRDELGDLIDTTGAEMTGIEIEEQPLEPMPRPSYDRPRAAQGQGGGGSSSSRSRNRRRGGYNRGGGSNRGSGQ